VQQTDGIDEDLAQGSTRWPRNSSLGTAAYVGGDDLERFIQAKAEQGFEARRDKLVEHFAMASARNEVMWPRKI